MAGMAPTPAMILPYPKPGCVMAPNRPAASSTRDAGMPILPFQFHCRFPSTRLPGPPRPSPMACNWKLVTSAGEDPCRNSKGARVALPVPVTVSKNSVPLTGVWN